MPVQPDSGVVAIVWRAALETSVDWPKDAGFSTEM